ncbi:MAG: hypothetical protein H0T42_12650 [Deltaproteobacteria bacterium]|nr:hypothetical protein [Deltaproteobacteria bacterium]
MQAMIEKATIGDHVFLEDGGEEIGAVRQIQRTELVIYVEGAGDFTIPHDAVRAVHYGKVVLDANKLEPRVLSAAQAAHANEINENAPDRPETD